MVFNTTLVNLPEGANRRDSTHIRHHGHGHLHLILTLAHILLALWAWLANVTQIVNLLLDRKLRRHPRSILIISISFSELLVAGFLCPLYTDSLIRGPWRHGLLVCSMYEVVFYLQVCVSSLAVLVLNVERFYFLVAPRMLQAPARRHVTTLLTLLPWVVGVVVVVPLFTQGALATLEHVPGLHHRTCVVEWERTLHIVTLFVTFLAPSFLLLATSVAVLILYVMSAVRAHEVASLEDTSTSAHIAAAADQRSEPENSRRQRHLSGPQEPDAKSKRECVTAVCVSSFLSVGLHFPFFTLLLLQQFCEHPQPTAADSDWSAVALLPESPSGSSSDSKLYCQFSDTAWITCAMLVMAKPGLLPLVWLIYSDIRAGFSPRACICPWWKCFKTTRWSQSASSRQQLESTDSAGPSVPSLASQMTVM